MTQEEKQLLLNDLCARLPYGVKINHTIYGWTGTAINFNRKLEYFAMEKDNGLCYDVPIEEILPYLRPLSSMTEKEKMEFDQFIYIDEDAWLGKENGCVNQAKIMSDGVDWLNTHYFDYRGLISMGLALEAPKDMYKK